MIAKSDVVLVVHTRQRPTGNTAVAGGIEYTLRRWSCTLQEGRPRSSTPTQLPYVKRVEFVLHETFPDNHRGTLHMS
ncbi:hypothetical protein FB639_005657 [Coemansia asiatica]|nr:hypothetical protein FB639_005657 [Coemansia asiatica]